MANNFKEIGKFLFARFNINLDEVTIEQLDHYIAVENYLMDEDETPLDAENLEEVSAYLQAFHHLSEVEDWERAKAIVRIQLGTPTNEELHIQLGTWGYYQEQIDLCSMLLGKLDTRTDSICLNTLGIASKEIGSSQGEANAIANISNTYYFMEDYSKAFEYAQQHLVITRQISDRRGEGTALLNLGNIYDALGEVDKAVQAYHQSLEIARHIGNREEEGRTLCNLGITIVQIGQYSAALEYLQTALNIVRETGERSTEAIILYNLVEVYQKLGHQNMAKESCDKALKIATELNLPDWNEYQELKEKLFSEEA